MATARELRTQKEEKLFDLRMAREMLKNGDMNEAIKYLETAEIRTTSGMNEDEIDETEARVIIAQYRNILSWLETKYLNPAIDITKKAVASTEEAGTEKYEELKEIESLLEEALKYARWHQN